MTKTAKPHSAPGTKGSLIHAAARYDLLIWLLTLGRERRFREMLLDHARLQPGESVLDVGCGTGTLAIAAKRRVGPEGSVVGIDASQAMIARAIRKARKAGVDVTSLGDRRTATARDYTFIAMATWSPGRSRSS
jgi:ubiquinone/menaquinone biosynthesis C-methylase UbiE